MASFTDSQGRTWNLNLTIGLAARLKKEYGLDFVGGLYDPEKAYAVLGELYQDLSRFPLVIHATAQAPPATVDELMDAMTGEDVQNAFEALDQAFTDFYPPGPKRERVARIKAKYKASLEAGQESLIPEIEQKIETEVMGALRETAALSTPGK